MKTIQPEIQLAIIDILPDDGELALKIMCQMLANMILSVDDASRINTIKFVRTDLIEDMKEPK